MKAGQSIELRKRGVQVLQIHRFSSNWHAFN